MGCSGVGVLVFVCARNSYSFGFFLFFFFWISVFYSLLNDFQSDSLHSTVIDQITLRSNIYYGKCLPNNSCGVGDEMM